MMLHIVLLSLACGLCRYTASTVAYALIGLGILFYVGMGHPQIISNITDPEALDTAIRCSGYQKLNCSGDEERPQLPRLK